MSVRVAIRPGCTGMGSCVRLTPQVFRLDGATGKAIVLVDDATASKAGVIAAAEACPFVAVEIDGVPLDEPVATASVVSATMVTADVCELRLRTKDMAFVPGQYRFVRLRDAGGEFFRPWSVAGVDGDTCTFAVRFPPNGRAAAVLKTITPGTAVGISRSKGTFRLLSADRPKLFVAGGTGLAPVMPMCRAAPTAPKTIIFGARTEADLFWREAMRALPNTTVIEVVQNPGQTWTGETGLVTDVLAKLDLGRFDEFYACGAPGMVKAIRGVFASRGIPPERLQSDSFETSPPQGAGPAAVAGTVAAPIAPSTDWPGLFRRWHGIASMLMAAVILFYAVTGFIANRSDLFSSLGGPSPTSERAVPAQVGLARATLEPWILGTLPAGATVGSWEETGGAITATAQLGSDEHVVSIDTTSRATRTVVWHRLPDEVAMTPAALCDHLGHRLGGEAKTDAIEDEETTCSIDFESVWGAHAVTVDKAAHRWRTTDTTPSLAVALTDLHRGKHAHPWQRFIVDAAALVLALVTISGAVIGFASAPKRRRLLLWLMAGSAALLVVLVINR
jgi:benzoate/toluate 1,2-dioxygenase reductase subunit